MKPSPIRNSPTLPVDRLAGVFFLLGNALQIAVCFSLFWPSFSVMGVPQTLLWRPFGPFFISTAQLSDRFWSYFYFLSNLQNDPAVGIGLIE